MLLEYYQMAINPRLKKIAGPMFPLSFEQSVLLSWTFKIIYSSYSVSIAYFLLLGLSTSKSFYMFNFPVFSLGRYLFFVWLIYICLDLIFFPLKSLFIRWLGGLVIRSLFAAFSVEEFNQDEVEKRIDDLYAFQYSSYFYLLIPFIGPTVQKFMAIVITYYTFKYHLKLSFVPFMVFAAFPFFVLGSFILSIAYLVSIFL